MLTIYHNPRCRKSRETLGMIEAAGIAFNTVLYLQNPPTASELREIVNKLSIPVQDLIRKNEKLYKEQFISRDINDEEWYSILATNPILIERPIVIKGDAAVLGRPPENVQALL